MKRFFLAIAITILVCNQVICCQGYLQSSMWGSRRLLTDRNADQPQRSTPTGPFDPRHYAGMIVKKDCSKKVGGRMDHVERDVPSGPQDPLLVGIRVTGCSVPRRP